MRTMKHAAQARLDIVLDAAHPVMNLLNMHANNVPNNYHAHKQTRQTAYAYLHGREAPDALAEFGERVLYCVPATPRKQTRCSPVVKRVLGARPECR